MIAKGTTHDNGGRLATYLITGKQGERAELWQLRGFAADDIKTAFRSIHVMAEGTRCEKPLFHLQVRNPEGEHLTRDQWERVADRIESKLGLSEQPRAIAFHLETATGHEHMHIGWSRIDHETMTAKALPFFKLRLKEVSRELETELGLTPVRSERPSPVMAPSRDEDEQARRLGVDIRDVRATIRECWERSDNGRSFQAALSAESLILAKGDKRDLVAIDPEGGMHALGKRVLGNTAAEVRNRTADLDRGKLPTIQQARELLVAQHETAPEKTMARVADPRRDEEFTKAAAEYTARRPIDQKFPTPKPSVKLAQELSDTATEILNAYRSSSNAAGFAATLGRNGIRLAVVNAKEARESHGVHRENELVAVTQTGEVYQVNEQTTGDENVDEFLAPFDHTELLSIEETQQQIDLEIRRHIALTQVGILPAPWSYTRPAVAPAEEVDWERLQTDRVYRREAERRDREQRAARRQQQEQPRPRSRDPDRY